MHIFKRLAAALTAAAVTVSSLVLPAAAEDSKVSLVSTPYSGIVPEGNEFGKLADSYASYGVGDIFMSYPSDITEPEFKDVTLYGISAEAVEKFRSDGTLSFDKVTYDSELGSVSTVPLYSNVFGDFRTKTYTLEYDRKNNKLAVCSDRSGLDRPSFTGTYVLRDGSTLSVEMYNSSKESTFTMTPAKGKKKTVKFKCCEFSSAYSDDNYFYVCTGDDSSGYTLSKLENDLSLTKITQSKPTDKQLFTFSVIGKDGDTLFLSKNLRQGGADRGTEVSKLNTVSGKETVIYTDNSDEKLSTYAYYSNGYICISIMGEYKNGVFPYTFKVYSNKTGKLVTLAEDSGSYVSGYYFAGDYLIVNLGDGDERIYDAKNDKYVLTGYSDITSITGGLIACKKKDADGKTLSVDYYDKELKKADYDCVVDFMTKIRQSDNGAFYVVDYTLVMRNGKAWFVDYDLKKSSETFDADEIWGIAGGIFGYSFNGKKYFATFKENKNDNAAAKPDKVSSLKVKSKTSKTLTLSWGKAEGAQGYRVDIYKNGKWVKVSTTKKTSAKIKSLKSGTSYKIRVRAYTKTNGKTVYGSAVTITAKTK